MKVQDVAAALDHIAPREFAAEWDNVGLIVGDGQSPVSKLMLCIDLTHDVLAEANSINAQMVMSYHPPIFKPVATVTSSSTPLVYEAIRRGLAVYSIHTAYDVVPGGVNDALAGAMGLAAAEPLEHFNREWLCKITVFVPPDDLSRVSSAAFDAGAGRMGNYYDCSFFTRGIGSFCPTQDANPTIGSAGKPESVEELRLEFISPCSVAGAVCAAVRGAHSYEEPAIDVVPMRQYPAGTGMGRIGKLDRPTKLSSLLSKIKQSTGVQTVLLAGAPRKDPTIRTVACGAGSCGSLYKRAISSGADFYLTGEMRHHDALAAASGGMIVACLGHSNSERLALGPLAKRLGEMLAGLKIRLSKQDSDPFVVR